MAKVNVRGVEHYYEWIRQPEAFPKPVMVFIHGWGGSARYWQSTAEALCDRFDCLLYDLRGFGRSLLTAKGGHPQAPPLQGGERMTPLLPSTVPTQPQLSYELEEYAQDLASFLDVLNLERVYLMAHSMGASVATLFLNLYPQRVEKAILTCSGIFEYDKKAFAAFYQFGGYVVRFRYRWFLRIPFLDRVFMARFLHRPIAARERQAFLEDFVLADYEAALGTIYTSVSQKAVEVMPQEFSKVTVPTLLISGEEDIIIPAEMGRKAAALNDNIEFAEIAKTAHFPMLEDAETYLAKVRKFLDSSPLTLVS